MQTETYLYIILATIVSIGMAMFQYFYKVKKRDKLSITLSFLRFLALFGLFLLLINPKFTKNEYSIEKANLVFLVDNSSSVKASKAKIASLLDGVQENKELAEQFNLKQYNFGNRLNDSDSLIFEEKNTNITKALTSVNEIYSKTNTAVVLLTDGNQTLGADYEFYGKDQKFPIYPIILGDTTRYEDIKITQVNANAYAFFKNKYPIEAYVSYDGNKNVSTTVRILVDGKTAATKNISLSKTENTKIISTLINANSVGVKNIRVSVATLANEKNILNNQKNIAVEVIDEKTNIAIITQMLHPDIGAIKKAIESNEQRQVSILRPNVSTKELADIDLFILYQPNSSFKSVYEYIKLKKTSLFTITGTKTDWNFLNIIQNSFTKSSYNQSEEVIPTLNSGFTLFNTVDFSVDDFPPLINSLGEIIVHKSNEVLLGQKIKGVTLNDPLLSIINDDGVKEAVLFGENLWKWRMQSYRNTQNFRSFDDFFGKIVLYLATTKSKNRLVVDYKPIYEGSNEAKVTATYFDEAFVFNANASLTLTLIDEDKKVIKEVPMLLKENYYEADLSNLPSDKYTFKVSVKNEKITKGGSFIISDFNVEEQFLSSNYTKLNSLAEQTRGKLYFPKEKNALLEDILADKQFLPTQKSKENVVSLIDFRILLGIIVISLALEWFIRKYNGLI